MSKLYLTSSVHTHTTYCDGKNSPAQMAQAAYKQGIQTLGFSGHIYTPADTSYCMTPEQTTQYKQDIAQLQQEYAQRMDILCGIEYDSLAPFPSKGEYDYTIGSVHAIYGAENGTLYPVDLSTEVMQQCILQGFGGNTIKMLQEYYQQVVQVAQYKPTILGHFDLIVKTNRNGVLFDEQDKGYLNLALEALDACIEQGVCFEMNTGAIWRGWREEAYPDDRLLKRLAEKKAMLTITADSHQQESLLYGYDRCAQRAKYAGFKEIFVLTKEGFVPCNLQDIDL